MSLRITFLFFLVAAAHATNVLFENNCADPIQVYRTENGLTPGVECNLGPGANCSGVHLSNFMNFKNGTHGKTLVEIAFDFFKGLDFYCLSVVEGFDVPVMITPSRGAPRTCVWPGCPDAYKRPNDGTIMVATQTGGTFTVTFCPITPRE